MNLNGKKIILGSGSPRRRELLAKLCPDFEVDTQNTFEEKYNPDTPHELIPVLMSEGKSNGFHRTLAGNEILITADTMVLCGDKILGKPASKEGAVRMLKSLSGRTHRVITAVTLRDANRKTTFSDTAYVTFNNLTDSEIEFYVDTFNPLDKAGAYGIQEWLGYIGISSIQGSFYTIMGFPTHLVYRHLLEF